MIKKYVVAAFLAISGIVYFFYNDKIKDQNKHLEQVISPSELTDKNKNVEALNHEEVKTLVSGDASSLITENTAKAPETDAPIKNAVEPSGFATLQDKNGKAETRLFIQDKRLSDAISVVNKNSDLDPSEEFGQLELPDFSNQNTKMLTGTFVDQKNKVELAIMSEDPKDSAIRALSKFSCFGLNPGLEVYASESLSLKDDKSGYAVLQINENTYARVKFAFDPERLIYGKVYTKNNNGQWSQVKEFTATETYEKLKYCYKSKFSEANNP